jgi:type I restriction enzyme M protein
MPPAKNADYAFLLHIIKSLNENGRAGVVVPHGVLFRSGAEGRIREQIIRNDLLEAVIGLPQKLFYGTGIPAAILILNKNKAPNKKGKFILVDAQNEFEPGKNQNRLRKTDIDRVSSCVDEFLPVNGYSAVVDVSSVEENNFSLNLGLYIESATENEVVEVSETLAEITILRDKREKHELDLIRALKAIGYGS